MKRAFALSLVLVGTALAAEPALAKGCIKGAIVGGIAGHMAGHGVVGAAAGCAIGRHRANEQDKQRAMQADQQRVTRP